MMAMNYGRKDILVTYRNKDGEEKGVRFTADAYYKEQGMTESFKRDGFIKISQQFMERTVPLEVANSRY